ncbi:MAG: hypothetical protein IKB02_03860, partial [Clostridia bacterium]|nr:hypothetical protein [Clostridia bacterium]
MKKLLKLVSIILVVVMILPMTPIEIFAVESEQTQTTPTVNADGTKTYTVNGYKAATADGDIGTDEYSVTAELSPSAYATASSVNALIDINSSANEYRKAYVSEEVSVSFSHDADKIYLGIYDKSGTATDGKRNGYAVRLGFDEEHPENFVGFYLQCINFTSTNGSKTNVVDELRYKTSSDAYPQAGYRGIVRSNGNVLWWATTADTTEDGCTRMFYSEDTAATYPITAMKVVREDVDGDITLGTYGRITSGQHCTYYEVELDKTKLLNFYNGMTFNNGSAAVENLDTMLFGVHVKETDPECINTLWGGSMDDGATDISGWNLDKVVFNAPVVEENPLGGEFATSTHATSLTQYGQDIYSTGDKSYNKAPTLDGKINADEGWVLVTPDYLDKFRGSSLMNRYSGRGWDNSGDFGVHADPMDPLANNIKIYVAQTATKVYVAFENVSAWVDANDDGVFTADEGMLRNNYHLMVGFNPNDNTQLLKTQQKAQSIEVLIGAQSDAKYSSSDTVKAVLTGQSTASYHYSATAFASAGEKIENDTAYDNKNYTGEPTAHWVGHLEYEFDKAAVKAAYAEVFGVTLADDAFNTIYVGGQTTVYTGVTAASLQHLTFGSVVSTTERDAVGLKSTYIPDVVVFGTERSGSVYANCSFTGHSTEARYLVEGTTDTYYHACTHCGMAGAATFKVVDDALVYDKEVVSEDTEITAGNCSTMGTYYKSCSCGLISTSAEDTFEFGGDHDFTAEVVAEKYEQKAPTCIAGGIYYVSCKVCGETSEDTTAEDTFTTPSTLWPEGVVKPVYHGQRTFYAGENYTVTDSQIYMKDSGGRWGKLEDLFVKVNNEPVTGTVLNTYFASTSTKNVSLVTNKAEAALSSDYNYYVAKSEDKLYFAYEEIFKTSEEGINGQQMVLTWRPSVYRIGFNTADYTQQLVIQFDGHGLPTQNVKVSAATETTSTVIHNSTVASNPYFEYIVQGKDAPKLGEDRTKIRKFAFTIDTIKQLWLDEFGVTLTDEDFNSLYIAVSNYYSGNVKVNNSYVDWYTTYGTILPNGNSAEVGLSTLIPDLIVFGSEKTFCDYTEHVATDTYLVAGTTDTYYHSCPICGDAGTRTFKVVDGSYYTAEDTTVEGATVKAATCESAGTYIKSCSCGLVDTDTTNTFTAPALGHTGETSYDSDGTEHWTVCSVCKTDDHTKPAGCTSNETHDCAIDKVLDGETNLATTGNCVTASTFYKVCECDYFNNTVSTFLGDDPAHTGANERLTSDGAGKHWTVCDTCFKGDGVLPDGADESYKVACELNKENAELEGAEIEAPNCTEKGTYRLSCECGYVDTANNTDTFEVDALGHTFNDKTTKTHKKNDATCLLNETYFVECSVCHVTSEGTDDEETYEIEGTKDAHIAAAIESGDRYTVDAKAPSCSAFGWNTYEKCNCGYDGLEAAKIPSLHTTAGTPTLAQYIKQNTPIHVTGANVLVAPNASDAKVSEGEYSVSYEIDAPVALTNQYMYNSYNNWTEVSKDSLDADVQKVIDSEKVRYSFAQDEDHYYVAIEHISGIGDTYNNQCTRYEYAFVINPGLANEKTIAFVSQYQFNTTKWSTGSFQVMNAIGNKDSSITTGWLGNADRPNWSAITYSTGAAGALANVFDASYVAKRFQNEAGVFEFDNYTVEKGLNHANGWTLSSCATTIEMVLNKAELAALLGADATVEDLSDVLGFTCMTTTGMYNKASVAGTAAPGGAAQHLLWNGTSIFGSDNLGFANDVRVNPDLVVFGEDDKISCNFTHIIDDKYKIATDENGVTSYYHACDGRDCGLMSSTVYYVDAEGNIIYNVETLNAKTEVTCESEGEYYFGCACGVLDPAGSTYTVEALGHEDNAWLEFNADGHWTVCDRCDTEGTAIPEGGSMVDHKYDQTDILEGNMAVLGDCDTKTTYYMNCECGHFLDTNETFEGDYVHKIVETVDEKYLLYAASCTQSETYYKSCELCGKSTLELFGAENAETFLGGGAPTGHSSPLGDIEAKAPTCISIGWNAHKQCTNFDPNTGARCTYTEGYEEIAPTRWPKGAEAPVFFGQRTFLIGDENYTVSDATMGVYLSAKADGSVDVDRRWEAISSNLVKVNDAPIKPVIVNTAVSGKSNNASLYIVDEKAALADSTPDMNYYVAKSSDRIFVSFEEVFKYNLAAPMSQHTILTWSDEYYRIGFNPDDPSQQLVMKFSGHGLPTQELDVSVADATTATKIHDGTALGALDLVEHYVGGSDKNTIAGESRIRNFAFDYDAIKELWAEHFDVTLTDDDFNSIYVEASFFCYGDVKVNDAYVTWSANYGTTVTSAKAAQYGVSTLIPDTIVFGNQGIAEDARCDYTGHSLADIYYAGENAKGEKMYFHSCKYCGDKGDTVFTLTNDSLGFDSHDGSKHWYVCNVCDDYDKTVAIGGITFNHEFNNSYV